MSHAPETRYASSRGAQVAFQILGEGEVDLLFMAGVPTHCEHIWDFGVQAQWRSRMATFSRLIAYDQRGMGLSDPLPDNRGPTLDDEVADAIAVIEAAGSRRAAVLAQVFAVPAAIKLAVERPDLVSHLLLYGGHSRLLRDRDYPNGLDPAFAEQFPEQVAAQWGKGMILTLAGGETTPDPEYLAQWGRHERMCLSPRRAAAFARAWIERDVRPLLSQVNVPVLVVCGAFNRLVPTQLSRYLVDHIPKARAIEHPGVGFLMNEELLDLAMGHFAEFLTGSPAAAAVKRELVTILFVDVASSTATAAEIGDVAWRALLDDFLRVVRRELARFDGQAINRRGDDVLATFASPTRAVACAVALREATAPLEIELRAGLHLGEIQRQEKDIVGLSAHIGARICALAGPGEVLVSQTVRDVMIGSDVPLKERGTHVLRGVPGEWRVYSVESPE